MAILTCFFLVLIIPYAASITFDFPYINQTLQEQFNVSGRASVSTKGIQVTPETRPPDLTKFAGRAIYNQLLHLWDKSSGELASFDTEFSFVIDSNMRRDYADGLTFLLAESNTLITAGGSLGLPVSSHSITYQFVAVEFDTFGTNNWDPKDINFGKHVGIDVNSLESIKYEQWMYNVSTGEECKAHIKYDSNSHNISVSVYNETGVVVVELNHTIDLREVLPERVIFGFSAATGNLFEKNTVKSWKFNSSNLQVDEEEDVNYISSTTAKKNSEKGGIRNKIGFVVGIIAGVVIAFLTIIAFLICRRKKKKPAEEVNLRADC